MTTNIEKFTGRHYAICRRAEEQFLEQKKMNPRFTVAKAVRQYAADIRRTLKRDTSLAPILAAQCTHLAMKVPLD